MKKPLREVTFKFQLEKIAVIDKKNKHTYAWYDRTKNLATMIRYFTNDQRLQKQDAFTKDRKKNNLTVILGELQKRI